MCVRFEGLDSLAKMKDQIDNNIIIPIIMTTSK